MKKEEIKMNINKITHMILAAALASGLFAAEGLGVFKGDGVKKISVQSSDIRQITCKGMELSANIVGADVNSIELYISKKPMSDGQLKEAELSKDESKEAQNGVSIDKKELKIDIAKKNEDGKYLTIYTPKNISVIVTFSSGDVKINGIKGELLLDGKSMDTDISGVSGVINYRNKSGDLKIDGFEGVLDIKTLSGDIELKDITGSVSVENTAGGFELSKFEGKLKCAFEVGDVEISSSKFSGAEIECKSGDVSLKDISGDKLELKASLGSVEIKDAELDMIEAELSAGELELTDVKSDIDFELNLGDVSLKDFVLLGKEDSSVEINFGEISLGFKDPSSYDFLKSVKDEKIDYEAGMEIDDDVRICLKNKKCLRIDTNIGGITVK